MAFDVSNVTGYVKQNEKTLVAKTILKGKTIGLIDFQPEIKGSGYLNNLSAVASIQAGACGWNAAGTSTITHRELKTGLFKVNEPLCEKDLIGTFGEWGVQVSVGKTTLPFEEFIIGQKTDSIKYQNELLTWQGDIANTGYTGTYLKQADGFIKLIGAEGTVVNATNSGKTLLAAPIDAIQLIINKIPDAIIDAENLVIFTGYDVVRAYIAAYNTSNQYAGTLVLDGTMTIIVPNTNIKLIGVPGLTGKNLAYASRLDNFVAGGDVAGDEAKYEFFYAQEAREFRLVVEYNLGFQVRFPDLIVKYTN